MGAQSKCAEIHFFFHKLVEGKNGNNILEAKNMFFASAATQAFGCLPLPINFRLAKQGLNGY